MKYWEFLALFILPWIALGTLYIWQSQSVNKKKWWLGTGFLMFLAFVYTTPWDNYLVKTQVWSYPTDRVLGRVGYVPVEEYSFFILQTYLAALWCFYVQQRQPISARAAEGKFSKIFGSLILAVIWLVSLLLLGHPHFEYLALILVWSVPVIFLQWVFAGNYFYANRKIFYLTVGPLSLYLWVADALALHWGIWSISVDK